jgi:alkylated DNA repair dioxygenase AlkB
MTLLNAPGLRLIPEFITESEEVELLLHLRLLMPDAQRHGVRDRNTIVRFGSNKPYDTHCAGKIPASLKWLLDKLEASGHIDTRPDSITINEYYPGQRIQPHIDHPDCGPVITVLSLSSPATMIFTKQGEENIVVELPRRSLVQMRDAIRYDWNHEIEPVADLRYSMVFRRSQ